LQHASYGGAAIAGKTTDRIADRFMLSRWHASTQAPNCSQPGLWSHTNSACTAAKFVDAQSTAQRASQVLNARQHPKNASCVTYQSVAACFHPSIGRIGELIVLKASTGSLLQA
jgi:hypothetical protein